jgi:hypothetical protein
VQIEDNTKRMELFFIVEMPHVLYKDVQIDCFRYSLSCVKVMKNRFYFWLFGKRKLPLQHHNMVKNRKSGTCHANALVLQKLSHICRISQ